jgi:hypothetical protein
VAWDTSTTGTITIHKGGALAFPTAASFASVGGGTTVITVTPTITVVAGNYIEVKANRGVSPDNGIFGALSVVLYFT